MKIGTWRIMDKFVIPNFDDPDDTYLTRWRILANEQFGIFLHRMDGPDSRPVLHDHPWAFISIVLSGGYEERRLNPRTMEVRSRWVRRFNVMRRDDAHYIARLARLSRPTWTLVLVGKRRRTWGYWERNPRRNGEWTWTEFDKHTFAYEYDEAMGARGLPGRGVA